MSSPMYPATSPTRDRRRPRAAAHGEGKHAEQTTFDAAAQQTITKIRAEPQQDTNKPAGGEAPADSKELSGLSFALDLHGEHVQDEDNTSLALPSNRLRPEQEKDHISFRDADGGSQRPDAEFAYTHVEAFRVPASGEVSDGIRGSQSPRLFLETSDLPRPSKEEPVTGATEFEGDESPILGMPGSFPVQVPLVTVEAEEDNGAEAGASGSSLHDGNVMFERQSGMEQDSILNHVRMMRASSSSSARTSPTQFTEDATSEKDDSESIQIMLGATPTITEPHQEWDTKDRAKAETDSSISRRLARAFDTSDPRISYLEQADTVHARDDQTPDGTPALSGNERFTLDGKAYSMVNQILEQYHSSSYVTPEMAFGFQQQVQAVSPELARHGHWESKQATQAYLQQLLRDATGSVARFEIPQTPPVADVSSLDPTGVRALNASPDDGYTGTAIIFGQPRKYGQVSEHQTPELEYPPTPPPKDWSYTPGALHDEAAESTPRTWADSRSRLSGVSDNGTRFGLAIQVASMEPSPTLPPLPSHSPPPPPPTAIDGLLSPNKQIRSPPSPSVHGQPPPSSLFPPAIPPVPAVRTSDEYDEERGQPGSANARHSQSITPLSQEPSQMSDVENDDQKRLKERRHLVKELLDTEFSHAQDMRIVEDIYKGTSTSIDTITDDDRRVLFSNSKEIADFSEKFISALKPAAASIYTMTKTAKWSVKRGSVSTSHSATTDQSSSSFPDQLDDAQDRKTLIGEAFLQNLTAMEKCYGTYIKSHEAANQRLVALQQRPKVPVWLAECRAYANDLTTTWDLDSLLVKPTQRLMKYPLILTDLLKRTPKDHPDYKNLETALRELRSICNRINETKKRAELVDQVVNRKRNQSDARLPSGLAKVIGRRTERLKQQVGLTESVDDQDYDAIAQKFGGHFFQLQIVMRDVEKYMEDVQQYVDRCNSFILAIEGFIDVRPGTFPELESKWRRYAMAVREITTIALPEHKAALTGKVINPILTLWKVHDNPQRMMQKRKKRIVDYARFKGMIDRGEKPDKKTQEAADQFQALNETLKLELPKLYALTKKLIEACLDQFIDVQKQWQDIWRRKVNVLDETIPDRPASNMFSQDMSEVVARYFSDFRPVEQHVESFVICDANQVKELCKMSSPSASIFTDSLSTKRPSTFASSKRTQSINSEQSAIMASPDFVQRFSGNFPILPPMDTMTPFASLFEFNIAHDRTEGGYPYLRYVPGEIFDVIGQKGELWLARNQDDALKKWAGSGKSILRGFR
ncbi:hypothetical protein H2199_003317 [Coniosporium tulheliwenetii]|uniref:Uncharacterized protein n=1 Tax=Coniosporium tulheliwenetii TaxID=3383036 RepID=A0ACC2ZBW4_9PEZI|nr:hypothetical protein H2199_003317 [Cladosporium sp. JES 115]